MIVWSILKILGLRVMSKIWGTVLDKWALATVIAVAAVFALMIAAQLRPSSHGAVTQAVTQAVAQRDAIQAEHDNQEVRDDEFSKGYIAQLHVWRLQAAASDDGASVDVIGADDPWLRKKRAGGR